MDRVFIAGAALLAFLGVALGAFGAHWLAGRLEPRATEIFETGVRYQMYHALGLFGVAWVVARWPEAGAHHAGWLMIAGTVVFSGSLYGLSLLGWRWLGAVTPLGGITLLLAWILLLWSVVRG